MSQHPMKFSVIIPTFNRREVVSASVLALERQRFCQPFEVIVVVDGSTDGTANRVRSLEVFFPLTVLEQDNRGLSVSRNRGAQAARGEILLFLDDDMEADPDLLAEHDRSHRSGADIVIGHLPLHPDSPEGVLKRAVGVWAEERLARLTAPGTEPGFDDLVGGQLSIRKQTFESLGGFDTDFTRQGAFGNEDIDFGYRARQQNLRIVFNPLAVSWQRYVVQPDAYLRQRRDSGRADVALARKYPERAKDIFMVKGAKRWRNRFLWRPFLEIPVVAPLLARSLRWTSLALIDRSRGYLARRLFKEAISIEYWRGVRDAGGIPHTDPPRVLAYHSISELPEHSPLGPWAVPPAVFEKQIDALLGAGFRFVDPDAVIEYLCQRRSLPSRALLLTFDDCYTDLLHSALPILRARRIPAVAFAVSSQIGGVNAWDRKIGAPQLRLLDADGLRMLASAGVEIGAHSRTHRLLPRLSSLELAAEVEGCTSDIQKLGLPRPRMFSYPHGEWDSRVATAVRSGGFTIAFTVRPGVLSPGVDLLALPRIEIFSSDTDERFLRKVSGSCLRFRLTTSARVINRHLRRASSTFVAHRL